MVYIAFYKGKGEIGNAAIRWWTHSQYSHCELIVDGMAYSSSIRDKGVRAKRIDFDPAHWDFVSLPWASAGRVLGYFARTQDESYSWIDLLRSHVFNRGDDEPGAAFCSDWCAAALGLPNSTTLSPATLNNLIIYLNCSVALLQDRLTSA